MALKLFELLGDDDRRFSPYCWRARMALAHKGLEAEYVPCKFTEKDKFAESGQESVPVLHDGERWIADSWDIACHLEDSYPNRPSLFGGAIGRGQARLINQWMPTVSRPNLLMMVKHIHDHAHPDDRAYFRASREKRFGETLEALHDKRAERRPAFEAGLAPLRATLETQPFVCGDAPAYGDYIVFGMFQSARIMNPEPLLEKSDVLYDWRGRMLDLFDGLGRGAIAHPE